MTRELKVIIGQTTEDLQTKNETDVNTTINYINAERKFFNKLSKTNTKHAKWKKNKTSKTLQ